MSNSILPKKHCTRQSTNDLPHCLWQPLTHSCAKNSSTTSSQIAAFHQLHSHPHSTARFPTTITLRTSHNTNNGQCFNTHCTFHAHLSPSKQTIVVFLATRLYLYFTQTSQQLSTDLCHHRIRYGHSGWLCMCSNCKSCIVSCKNCISSMTITLQNYRWNVSQMIQRYVMIYESSSTNCTQHHRKLLFSVTQFNHAAVICCISHLSCHRHATEYSYNSSAVAEMGYRGHNSVGCHSSA